MERIGRIRPFSGGTRSMFTVAVAKKRVRKASKVNPVKSTSIATGKVRACQT